MGSKLYRYVFVMTEMETYKLLLAASKDCAQFDPICICYFGSTEEASLGLCSLVGVFLVCVSCCCY